MEKSILHFNVVKMKYGMEQEYLLRTNSKLCVKAKFPERNINFLADFFQNIQDMTNFYQTTADFQSNSIKLQQ